VQRLGHNRALDGLRGIAILGVIFRHAFPYSVTGGGQGVELFFVLSGFLITTLLLEEQVAAGVVSLRAFYRRRAWRLLPALGLLLTVFLVVEVVRGRGGEGLTAVAANGFYTANIRAAWFPSLGSDTVLGPLWSLSQEEQFYVLWPAVLIFLSVRLSERRMMALLLLAVTASVVEAFVLTLRDGWWTHRTFGPDTHSGGLLVGALLAFVLRRPAVTGAWRFRPILNWLGLLPLVVIYSFTFPFGAAAPFVYAIAACLVTIAVCQQNGPVGRLISTPPLVWVGRISYSLYLWHIFFLWSFHWHHRGIALAVAVAAAYVSTCWFEEPLRRRYRIRRERLSAPRGVPALAD
jgi:peptidoglycan/LPS O-acetylase OafA/YrhL